MSSNLLNSFFKVFEETHIYLFSTVKKAVLKSFFYYYFHTITRKRFLSGICFPKSKKNGIFRFL